MQLSTVVIVELVTRTMRSLAFRFDNISKNSEEARIRRFGEWDE